ncbi:AraC family transcriptional regulator [Zooshikella sp. RANM57]|uniref:AraC family transcriptional regulator n=1 Tax=Zooshikella sp. RANM57 TaxID=3425863 RepID=UPI003D6EEFF8
MKLGNVSVTYIETLANAIHRCGINPAPLLKEFGLILSELSDEQQQVSIARFMRLGAAAITLTQEPGLGLLMGKHAPIQQWGLAGLLALSAPNMKSAITALIDYECLTSESVRGKSSLDYTENSCHINFYSISPYTVYNLFIVESVLLSWLQTLRWLAEPEQLQAEVFFEFPAPAYANKFKPFFKCPVHFSQPFNKLVISASSLTKCNRFKHQVMYNSLLATCEQKKKQLTFSARWQERVVRILSRELHGGQPTLEFTAAQLGLSQWTLRRKLNEESTSFQKLLNQTRLDLALNYVKETPLSFAEIAYLLGFSSPEAFQRAFKRWTTKTPGQVRQIELHHSS